MSRILVYYSQLNIGGAEKSLIRLMNAFVERGDDVYYLEETNEFVVVSTDGYIRTYFLPDGGKAYFDRQ